MVVRVFWPRQNLSPYKDGSAALIVGWQNGQNDFVVATLLPWLDLALAQQLLETGLLLEGREKHKWLKPVIGRGHPRDLRVIGTCNRSVEDADCFLVATVRSARLRNLRLLTSTEKDPARVQIIFYEQPNAKWLHYYSLEPMELSLLRQSRFTVISAEHEPDLIVAQKEHRILTANVAKHAWGLGDAERQSEISEARAKLRLNLETIIQQVNISFPCAQLLRANARRLFPELAEMFQPPESGSDSESHELGEAGGDEDSETHCTPDQIDLASSGGSSGSSSGGCNSSGSTADSASFARRRVRRLSISARNLGIYATRQAANNIPLPWSSCQQVLSKYLSWVVVCLAMFIRIVAEGIILALHVPGRLGFHVIDISTTAMQLHVMARTLAYYPEQYLTLRKDPERRLPMEYNVEYIRFYNSVWLLVNDRLMGYSLWQAMANARPSIFKALMFMIESFFGSRYEGTVHWLMSWPGGLKLHDELSSFIGKIVVWVIRAWQYTLTACTPALDQCITIVMVAGLFGGLSLQIAMLSDLLALLTLQVYLFYMGSAKIYRGMLHVLGSLFRLFRGRKFNVLRSRVDSGDFDLVQLMMGTLVFTILLFLLPTVATFYFAFTSMRVVLVLVQALAEMVLMFLNHFPLFILLLRVKSPGRVPGGIRLVRLDSSGHADGNTLLRMHSQPLTMRKIFSQYVVLANRFSKHYVSFSVIFGTLSGRHVSIARTRLYSLLHSMLPAERTTLVELWVGMCDWVGTHNTLSQQEMS